jgi:enoyl-CoA hydratase
MELMPGFKNDAIDVRSEGPLAVVTLNQPEEGNALGAGSHAEFEETMWRLGRHERHLRAIILTGAGDFFLSRRDKVFGPMIATFDGPDRTHNVYEMAAYARRLVEAMLSVETPMIAAINGDAIGLGSTIALMCDITVMDQNAHIGDRHNKYGVVPGDGGQVIYPLLIGPSRAKDMLMRGKTIDATEAERIGLITYVAPPGGALAIARDIATDIMTKPPLAVKWAKAAVNQQLFMMFHLNMRLGIASEALTFLSDDHKEAVHSIVDKRSPDYDGR